MIAWLGSIINKLANSCRQTTTRKLVFFLICLFVLSFISAFQIAQFLHRAFLNRNGHCPLLALRAAPNVLLLTLNRPTSRISKCSWPSNQQGSPFILQLNVSPEFHPSVHQLRNVSTAKWSTGFQLINVVLSVVTSHLAIVNFKSEILVNVVNVG